MPPWLGPADVMCNITRATLRIMAASTEQGDLCGRSYGQAKAKLPILPFRSGCLFAKELQKLEKFLSHKEDAGLP